MAITQKEVRIAPPNIEEMIFPIIGTAPYVQNKFSNKAFREMMEKMEKGGRKRTKKSDPRDFEQEYLDCMHETEEGWRGFPANGLRAALVDACRLTDMTMTQAKLAIFVVEDAFDKNDGTPLVRIVKGEPEMKISFTRVQQTVNMVSRAMWPPLWEANVRLRWDADIFTADDVGNLLQRVGRQVGLGCGRPNSKTSTGMGWGTFEIKGFEPTGEES